MVLKVNQLTGEKEIEQGDIFANTLQLKPRIKMRPKDDGQWIELHITAEDNINTFLDLFEFPAGFDIKQVNPEAKLILSYNQTGFVNPVQRPYSELDFEITNAEFTADFLPIPIKVSAIRGNYNNGEGHSPETVQLVIDTIHAEAGESFLYGRLKLENLKDPIIDASLNSFIDFSNLIKETDKLQTGYC